MIVLDTHIWLWWVHRQFERLTPALLQHVEQADRLAIAAISCFEVAWLERHGRIDLLIPRRDWFRLALEGAGIECLTLSAAIASRAVDLPEHHRDPQDRIIIATALEHKTQLMSLDREFVRYSELTGSLLS